MSTVILAAAHGMPEEALLALRGWAEDEQAPALPDEATLRSWFLHLDKYFYRRRQAPVPTRIVGPAPGSNGFHHAG
jgi:hypothetical protein